MRNRSACIEPTLARCTVNAGHTFFNTTKGSFAKRQYRLLGWEFGGKGHQMTQVRSFDMTNTDAFCFASSFTRVDRHDYRTTSCTEILHPIMRRSPEYYQTAAAAVTVIPVVRFCFPGIMLHDPHFHRTLISRRVTGGSPTVHTTCFAVQACSKFVLNQRIHDAISGTCAPTSRTIAGY
jgi:hypothetical protein